MRLAAGRKLANLGNRAMPWGLSPPSVVKITLREGNPLELCSAASNVTQNGLFKAICHSTRQEISRCKSSRVNARLAGHFYWLLEIVPKSIISFYRAWRLKATLERLQRLTQGYTDNLLKVFPTRVEALGNALGLPQEPIQVCQNITNAEFCNVHQFRLLLYLCWPPLWPRAHICTETEIDIIKHQRKVFKAQRRSRR